MPLCVSLPGGGEAEPSSSASRDLGFHPDTGLPVQLKVGPFGPYVQTEAPTPHAQTKGKAKKAPVPRRWVAGWWGWCTPAQQIVVQQCWSRAHEPVT